MAPSPQNSAEPALDAAVFAELTRDMGGPDAPAFKEAVNFYIEDAVHRLANVEEALPLKQVDRIKEEVHSLKGASAYFGAKRIQALCVEIETLLRQNTPGDVHPQVAALEDEFVRVRQALQK